MTVWRDPSRSWFEIVEVGATVGIAFLLWVIYHLPEDHSGRRRVLATWASTAIFVDTAADALVLAFTPYVARHNNGELMLTAFAAFCVFAARFAFRRRGFD
jgi:hypothetical protein